MILLHAMRHTKAEKCGRGASGRCEQSGRSKEDDRAQRDAQKAASTRSWCFRGKWKDHRPGGLFLLSLRQPLNARREAPDDVGITDPMDDRHDPEIARSPGQNTKEQTDRENRREHRDRERALRRKVIPNEAGQRCRTHSRLRSRRAHPIGEPIPTAHPAVNDLLIEAKEKIGHERTQDVATTEGWARISRSRFANTSGKTTFAITNS